MTVDAVKKYPMSSEESARFGNLGRETSTLTVLRHARIAEKMGLSGTDHKALDLVRQADGPMTAGRIAELTALSTGAVTGVIDRLEKAGFVRRVRDPQDRRKVFVEVAPIDEERFLPLFQSALDSTIRILESFSPEERKAIERFQNEMLAELRNEILGASRPG
jgi:DNA-binding MarR family transcriptional regulator